MWLAQVPPFLPLLIAALLAGLVRGHWRGALSCALIIASGLNLYLHAGDYANLTTHIAGLPLALVRIDTLSLLFGYLFHIAALICTLYAWHVNSRLQQVSGLLYAASAVGAVFAGDLISLFIFWELLALTSVWLIWARGSETALNAGLRYLIINVLSGVLLLAAALIIYADTGSLAIRALRLEGLGGWLMLIALGIKCAFPGLHTWLTDAYPQATATGTLYLSAFTTKVAVYALARMFAGEELLIWVGAAMTCFPIFYAVIENDLRKVLAYSLINQLGFMVVGIGVGTELALNGAVAHAFSDVIFKGLLFMSMGAVLLRVGHVLGSDLGGLYKSMPKTALLCIIGAASISAFPLFSGFISKSLVIAAVVERGDTAIWLMLLFASAGVFHHAGIKIPFFAFFAHDGGHKVQEAPTNMLIAMSLAALLCIGIGSFPQLLYSLLPWQMDYWPYDLTHILTQLQILFFSALAFVWLNKMGWYPPELRSVNLDMEWSYRKLLPSFASAVWRAWQRCQYWLAQPLHSALNKLPEYQHRHHWSTGQLTQRMALLLAVVLLLGAWLNLT